MPWTDPPQQETGDLITKAIWNTYLVDNLDHLYALHGAFAVLEDQKASGTDGGAFTSGAWRTRVLNTEVSDTHNIVALAANQFTPVAGTYIIFAIAPANLVNRHQARLYNVTAAAVVLSGESAFANSGANNSSLSIVAGIFTANGSDAYELQHQCQTTNASDGFGIASGGSFAVTTEIYSRVILLRLT